MRLDGYIRVSKVGGREGESFQSPTIQREQIERWAALRGVEIARWHEDLDVSGGTLQRPGLDALLDRLRDGRTDGLAVARLDRLSRAGVADALKLVDEVHGLGGQLAVVDLGIDPTTTFGEFAMTVMLALGRMQRRQLAESFRAAETNAIARGVHIVNAAPFGYLRGDDGRLAPDPETAALVREVFEMRAQGVSWRRLADWLNERSTTTRGALWTPRTVAHVIKRRTYLGEAYRGDVVNPDAHEPLITLAEFEAANAERGGTGAVRRESPLLSGLVRCAGCGYSMKASKTKTRAGAPYRRAYSCRKRHSGGVCSAPASITTDLLDGYVFGWFMTWYGDATAVEDGDQGEALADARRQRDDALARLQAYDDDDERRAILPSGVFAAGLQKRRDRLDRAEAEVARLEAEHRADERRVSVLREDAESWTLEEARFFIGRAIDSVFVRAGRGDAEDRTVVFAKGDGPTDLPQRGHRGYKPTSLLWPEQPLLASIPRWAWRLGHRDLPEGLRGAMNEFAAKREFAPLMREDVMDDESISPPLAA